VTTSTDRGTNRLRQAPRNPANHGDSDHESGWNKGHHLFRLLPTYSSGASIPPAMNRRAFVTGLGAVLAAPLRVGAQQAPELKTANIGFLSGSTPSSPSVQIGPFKQTLRDKGWTEGRNLTLAYRYAEGHYERLPTLARELVNHGVDLIVTDGTPPTQGAMRATTTIPIVMATTRRPGGLGLCP
jgi:hypothetical protein